MKYPVLYVVLRNDPPSRAWEPYSYYTNRKYAQNDKVSYERVSSGEYKVVKYTGESE